MRRALPITMMMTWAALATTDARPAQAQGAPAAQAQAGARGGTEAAAPTKAQPEPEAPTVGSDTAASPDAQGAAQVSSEATAEPAPAAASAPPPPALTDAERRRIAAERARLRAMLARARQERAESAAAASDDEEPHEELQPRRYGDAGAAIAVGLTFEATWNTDPGYDFFDDDDVGERLGVWASHDLLSFTPAVILAGELGWETGSEEARSLLRDTLATELETHHFHAGVQLRYVLLSWLSPHLRVVGGLSFTDIAMHSLEDNSTHEQELHWKPFASLGGGFWLRTPPRLFESREGRLSSFAVALLIEGGYSVASPAKLTLRDEVGSRAIPLRDGDLGELDRAGPYLRTSFVVRF
jgi:hypothetical protein